MTRHDVEDLKAVIASTALFPPEMLDELTGSYLAGTSADRWVVLDDATPACVACYAPERMTSETWNLCLIAVRSDRQRRGYGAALIDLIVRELAAQHQRVLIVETSGLPKFGGTHAFYRRCGFTREACIRDFYRDGDDKIVFWRRLEATPPDDKVRAIGA
ncbi:putative Acetyltransferase [Bradyrhizobium sp. ORS 278]|uniref:GNAT family N-acetyltransferase n=1 Tax=Bradyrhizobium sp. (strain ORS 278) TaxID=114615 RepID=UPI0001508A03|nr:GNAT family N-acetyltransferase [Bradyrhizobium sp. ORS 278]CAL79840.1 putative Acetyltransferase [Bradyrhizobium sp. ORS 278]